MISSTWLPGHSRLIDYIGVLVCGVSHRTSKQKTSGVKQSWTSGRMVAQVFSQWTSGKLFCWNFGLHSHVKIACLQCPSSVNMFLKLPWTLRRVHTREIQRYVRHWHESCIAVASAAATLALSLSQPFQWRRMGDRTAAAQNRILHSRRGYVQLLLHNTNTGVNGPFTFCVWLSWRARVLGVIVT